MYRLLYWLLLRHLPAEAIHHLGFALLRLLIAVPGVGSWIRRRCQVRDPVLTVRALGLEFPAPLGLAAGFDKDARGADALLALGFGFVEVGTVTAEAQPGNPRPRVFRLPQDHALINRLGFNNDGARAAAHRLARPRRGIVGVNIGKTKIVDEDHATADYVASTAALAPLADYLVVNVSSPNTPGLRNLQAGARLRPLLVAIRAAADAASPTRRVPLLVKIAPDLSDEELDEIAALALELRLDGIVATNTTIARTGLTTATAKVAAIGAGGLSGRPLKQRALEVLIRLRAAVGPDLTLIAVGGIESGQDAFDRLRAGATLVQAYTGFVYGGPAWPRQLLRDLGRRLRAAPVAALSSSETRTP
jgi:dihydroorotate dehydrogenase